jgi:hypothetical protein
VRRPACACHGQEAPHNRNSTVPARRRFAQFPNHVRALDFQHDASSDGRELKFLNVVHEFTREAMAIEVDRRSTQIRQSRYSIAWPKARRPRQPPG